MNGRLMISAVVLLVLVFLLSNALFVVRETERALLLQFGAVVRADIEPGLHFKIPIAQEVKKFDGRVLTLDSNPERYFTIEKKPLQVDSFVKWQITDVQKYYTATSGDELNARRRLQERVNEGLRNQISRRDQHEVVSGERDQLMAELTKALDITMTSELGMRVLDIRVKRIDLPDEVSSAVYDRMISERRIEAQQHRATGDEMALAIRADADRKRVVIEAEAYREAEQIRGEGDAKATEVYAEAFNRDPEFYSFYRSLEAYRNTFSNPSDLMLIDPDSDFFRYLRSEKGGK